jgi:hypothetical protein
LGIAHVHRWNRISIAVCAYHSEEISHTSHRRSGKSASTAPASIPQRSHIPCGGRC